MDALFAGLTRLVEQNVWIAPFASFLGGVLTASNPCVLVMIPLAIAYVGRRKGDGSIFQKPL